ncbi:hypothetical protein [Clostridium gasigenes]|uniref:Uncharacterized protein n=1 Tax=Clostridium gasigenes TaxID=94869 RepID=A0A1H0M764_9CLOT|nr:hypothetical protein [Clostridium gasigenes]SDO76328.1 hypothetical protein SAMN04488529_101350 [Clostridium gasigenes]
MIERPIFWDYITTNDDGELDGIRKDAPEDMKKAYDKYLKDKEEKKKELVKI